MLVVYIAPLSIITATTDDNLREAVVACLRAHQILTTMAPQETASGQGTCGGFDCSTHQCSKHSRS